MDISINGAKILATIDNVPLFGTVQITQTLIASWLVLLIIAREFMVTSIRLVAAGKGSVIAANNWGKAKTVSQIVAICVILLLQYIGELGGLGLVHFVSEDMAVLFWCIGEVFLAIATLFAVLSGLIYLKQNWDIVKNAK